MDRGIVGETSTAAEGEKMNLRIELPPHIEELLKSKAAQAGLDVEAFVLETISERLEPKTDGNLSSISAEQFSEWIANWSKQFPVLDHQIDDSRESIYAGRGE